MKVIFAIKTLNNMAGGAERVFADITSALADQGFDVSALSFDRISEEPFYALNPKVNYTRLGLGNPKRRAGFFETLKRIRNLRQFIIKNNPDVVIAFMHSTFIPVSFALIGTGIPVIASEHIIRDHYKNRRLEFSLFCLSSLFIKKFTVLSPSIRKTYPRFLHYKMMAISNPVPVAKNISSASDTSIDPKIILSIGRLDPQKDQETLIKAFSKLADKYTDWNLRIIGEGNLRPQLQSLIKNLNLETRISLPGATSQIDQEYARAQIFAIPSRYESFGLAAAEAMAHSLPVLAFADCPGLNELIVDQENGMLATPQNRIESFASSLEILMTNSGLRKKLGSNAMQNMSQYSLETISRQWVDLLEIFRPRPQSR